MGGASEQVMQIHVTGTLADPKTNEKRFPAINQALQTLQTGMQPQNTLPPPPSGQPITGLQPTTPR